jgi:hypothetical protein
MKSSIIFSFGCTVIIASILCTNCEKDDSLTENDVMEVLQKTGKLLQRLPMAGLLMLSLILVIRRLKFFQNQA